MEGALPTWTTPRPANVDVVWGNFRGTIDGMASAEEQTRRNQQIVAARLEGRTLEELAEDHGLGVSRVKEILAKARQDAGDVPTTGAMRAVEARRREYAEAAAEVRRLALALRLRPSGPSRPLRPSAGAHRAGGRAAPSARHESAPAVDVAGGVRVDRAAARQRGGA